MNEDVKKKIAKDTDGLLTYEYIANHIGECDEIMPELVQHMIEVDRDGQFSVSAARYLCAINCERYRPTIDVLVSSAIDKDREHRYIGELLPSIWGADYADHAQELCASDRNFRRIYNRLYPAAGL